VWVAAYDNGQPIGFARALHDGLNGEIVEMCLDFAYQSWDEFQHGCFVESDPYGFAKNMAIALLKELRRRGSYFFSTAIFKDAAEKEFYIRLWE